MKIEEYTQYDAIGLAELIRSTDVSASEVIQTAMGLIEELNPSLNAVIATDSEVVKNFNDKPSNPGRLYGVPYLVKDLNTWVAGLPATNGSRAFAKNIVEFDGELVLRLRKTGLAILGKTNTPEFGLNICTAPLLFGATPNPFDPDLSSGGSSGGSACAVAAGIVPAAHATDSGGSIRIPASNCGLYGLKPSRARVPLGNNQAEGLAGFSTAHAVTHSVRDSALLLDLTAGPMAGDFYSSPSPHSSFLDDISKHLPILKIAYWDQGFSGEQIDQECQLAAQSTAQKLESLGFIVEYARPEIDGNALRHAFDVLFSANIKSVVDTIRIANPKISLHHLIEPTTISCSQAALKYSATDYISALQTIQSTARKLGQFFEKFDILVTPTLANPPLPLGSLSMSNPDWESYLDQLLNEIPFTPLFNATGAPAASLPLSKSEGGSPIGVQLGAKFGAELLLLQLSHTLEKEFPWHSKK